MGMSRGASTTQLREATEAALRLLTLVVSDEHDEAVSEVMSDDVYSTKLVSMVLASFASLALKFLAEYGEETPLSLVREIALAAAIEYAEDGDGDVL